MCLNPPRVDVLRLDSTFLIKVSIDSPYSLQSLFHNFVKYFPNPGFIANSVGGMKTFIVQCNFFLLVGKIQTKYWPLMFIESFWKVKKASLSMCLNLLHLLFLLTNTEKEFDTSSAALSSIMKRSLVPVMIQEIHFNTLGDKVVGELLIMRGMLISTCMMYMGILEIMVLEDVLIDGIHT